MMIVWLILLVVLNLFWLFLVAFGIPGNWLMLLSVLVFTWLVEGQVAFDSIILWVVGGLALAGEIIEIVAGVRGAKKGGAKKWGSIGALLGSFVGAIVGTSIFPLIGTLIGIGVGAFLGAVLLETITGRKLKESTKAGASAGVGQVIGTSTKLFIGVVIWLVIAIAAFW